MTTLFCTAVFTVLLLAMLMPLQVIADGGNLFSKRDWRFTLEADGLIRHIETEEERWFWTEMRLKKDPLYLLALQEVDEC